MLHARIFRGPNNHMPPVTSNHGGNSPKKGDATVYKKGFQMAQLPPSYCIGDIYTIPFKMVYLDHFIPFYVESGKQYHTALETF